MEGQSVHRVLWALQGAGWGHRALSSRSQHSRADFSSFSYGRQEKHGGGPLCGFHSRRESAGRPVEKGDVWSEQRQASGTPLLVRHREGALQAKTAALGTREGADSAPEQPPSHSILRHELTDMVRAWAFTDDQAPQAQGDGWILTEELPASQGRRQGSGMNYKNGINKSLASGTTEHR